MIHSKVCRECGAAFTAKAYQAIYCSEPCRRRANTRRRTRGCEVYDLLMLATFEDDGSGKDAAALKLVEALKAYRRSDEAKRGGRKSWRPWRHVVVDMPVKYDQNGDNR